MKLTSPSSVRALLDELGVHPSKSLGQNFLIDLNILDIIVGAASVSPADRVLEIGAGLGVLTERLISVADRVMAVEVDTRLAAYLGDRFAGAGNLELMRRDARDLDYQQIAANGFNKVVANLPYSVGSRVLMDLVMIDDPMDQIVVTVQQEVAERILAGPGSRDYGLLGVWGQLAYEPALRKTVAGTCFWPSPDVSSAVVSLVKKPLPAHEVDKTRFMRLTKYAFSQRRKQLKTVLRNAPPDLRVTPEEAVRMLDGLGVDSRSRPADITVTQWCELTNMLTGDEHA